MDVGGGAIVEGEAAEDGELVSDELRPVFPEKADVDEADLGEGVANGFGIGSGAGEEGLAFVEDFGEAGGDVGVVGAVVAAANEGEFGVGEDSGERGGEFGFEGGGPGGDGGVFGVEVGVRAEVLVGDAVGVGAVDGEECE